MAMNAYLAGIGCVATAFTNFTGSDDPQISALITKELTGVGFEVIVATVLQGVNMLSQDARTSILAVSVASYTGILLGLLVDVAIGV